MSNGKTPKYGTSLDNEENAGTAARERETARQNRASAEFVERTNAAIEAFDDADEDRESVITEVHINLPAQVAAANAKNSLRPTIRPPPVVAAVLARFPKPWRPIVGLVFLVAALVYGPQVPAFRAILGMDPLPAERRERPRHRPPVDVVEPEPVEAPE